MYIVIASEGPDLKHGVMATPQAPTACSGPSRLKEANYATATNFGLACGHPEQPLLPLLLDVWVSVPLMTVTGNGVGATGGDALVQPFIAP
jgi:hypothetical protein